MKKPVRKRSEAVRARRHEREKQARLNANLPFVCGVDNCTASYATLAGCGTHRRRAHAVLGRARRGKIDREEIPAREAALARVRARVVRGQNADSARAWEIFAGAMFGRKKAA